MCLFQLKLLRWETGFRESKKKTLAHSIFAKQNTQNITFWINQHHTLINGQGEDNSNRIEQAMGKNELEQFFLLKKNLI